MWIALKLSAITYSLIRRDHYFYFWCSGLICRKLEKCTSLFCWYSKFGLGQDSLPACLYANTGDGWIDVECHVYLQPSQEESPGHPGKPATFCRQCRIVQNAGGYSLVKVVYYCFENEIYILIFPSAFSQNNNVDFWHRQLGPCDCSVYQARS